MSTPVKPPVTAASGTPGRSLVSTTVGGGGGGGTPPPPPRRGGIHPTYGLYIGGSKLNDHYRPINGAMSYRFATQRRNVKTIGSITIHLIEQRDSTTTTKFNGQLEASVGNSTELGKEQFVTALKTRVREHGHQSFFHIRDADGKVVDLFDNAHRFKLADVIAEHERRLDPTSGFEAYDTYELDEITLSSMVVESLLDPAFRDKIAIRFNHRDDFDDLPGSCKFLMALETCHASVSHDVEGATTLFQDLTLDSYAGENVADMTSEAQRLIKIMQGDYALPVNIGSRLLVKVTKTSSDYFNRKMFNLLDETKALERDYKLADPKTLVADPRYHKFGPLALIGTIQSEYGTLRAEKEWPALISSLPQGNLADNSVPPTSDNGNQNTGDGDRINNGRRRRQPRCFRCGEPHVIRDCPYPPPGNDNGNGTNGNNGNGNNGNNGNTTDQPGGRSRQLAAWKFIRPADLNDFITDESGRVWKHCTKCRDRASGRVGIYQLSHSDSEHIDNYRASQRRQGNLTSVNDPDPVPPGPPTLTTPPPGSDGDVSDDPDALEFNGMWCTEISDDGSQSVPTTITFVRPMVTAATTVVASTDTTPPSIIERENQENHSQSLLFVTNDLHYVARRESPLVVETVLEDFSTNSESTMPALVSRSTVDIDVETVSTNSESTMPALVSRSTVDIDVETVTSDSSSTIPELNPRSRCKEAFDAHDEHSVVEMFPSGDQSTTSDMPSLVSRQFDDDSSDGSDSFGGSDWPYCVECTMEESDPEMFFDCLLSDDDLFEDCATTSESLLPEDLCGDLEEHRDVFHDTYEESPPSEWIKGIEFFDSNGPAKLTPDILRPDNDPTSSLILYLFWLSGLMWDTLLWFLQPARLFIRISSFAAERSPTSCTQGRFLRLRKLPSKWMVFTGCIMMLHSVYQGQVPTASPLQDVYNHCQQESSNLYQRIHQLDNMVMLNTGTLVQYQRVKFGQVLSIFESDVTPAIAENEKPSSSTSDIDHNEFYDSYTVHTEHELYFFDAVEIHEAPIGYDPFGFHDLGTHRYYADCVYESADDHLQSVTDAELNAVSIRGLTGISQLEQLAKDPEVFMALGNNKFPVIFDTGASLAISPSKDDFDGPFTVPSGDLRLGGMANGLKIEGIAPVKWTFATGTGNEITIRSLCYYVPDAKARLISPQRLFNRAKGVGGNYTGDEDSFRLNFTNGPTLTIDYNERNHLPIGYASLGESTAPQINIALTSDDNQNLSAGQKLLLQMHARFGHLNFPAMQRILRSFPFLTTRFGVASKCDISELKCDICEFAKGHRRSLKSHRVQRRPERDGALKDGHLSPGACVSVDHFESRLPGRTYDSYGKPSSDTYVGGCIFVDHASGLIHVEHQLGFSASETIRAKQNFEKLALDHGVIVTSYLTDSGAFKANKFVSHIREHSQRIQYCGTNAHHQNGCAERSIRSVSNMARAFLLHASCHWKNGIDSSLWPMAVIYATHVYNHTPNSGNICPADIFTGTTVPRHRLRDLHTWGCPVYVLDPKLQAGKKLPRWQPRSRRGIFLGLSNIHSSEVPFVLNLQTGSITTQYHVVFDDQFSTVESIAREELPPEQWQELCLEHAMSIPTDESAAAPLFLQDDWLTPSERAHKQRELQRLSRIRTTFNPKSSPEGVIPSVTSEGVPSHFSEGALPTTDSEGVSDIPNATKVEPTTLPPTVPPSSSTVADSSPRRSQRSNKGLRTKTKYMDEVFLSQVDDGTDPDTYGMQLAYLAELYTCYDTGSPNISDPRVYAAKKRNLNDPDNPTFHQAVNGDNAEDYLKAMKLEVATLIQQKAWTQVPRTPDMNVLKGTWAFKLKRLPDGTAYRFKARYCARGDLQQENVDFFETYSPVVQWSTIRLLLTTVLVEGWCTRQVDYTNAFAQAEIAEEVYVEPPRMFAPKSGKDLVLRLLKSLYGLRQAPRTFFEKLRDGLLDRGFVQSELDPCLFMKKGIICVCYVDDTIFAGATAEELEREIKSLGVTDEEQRHSFQLRDEGEVGAFLGIQITKEASHAFKLTQTGLIDKVLKTSHMEDCNGVGTPASNVPIGTDTDGPSFDEPWQYSTVIGMLMYLSANSRPDIAYAVHQAARFTHAPRASHAVAVKRILRYLKRTRDKGLILKPSEHLRVDCHVDADFAGLFAVEDGQDPISVKSRTGYVIMYRDTPLLWVSKLQTQIALSTMEAEYIALSQSMRDLIPIREILKELMTIVFERPAKFKYVARSKAFSDANEGCIQHNIEQSTVYEDNQACLKFARMPKLSPRTKHIGIPYHWFRTKVDNLDIQIEPIESASQLGDGFTKGLPIDKFETARKTLMGW